MSEYQVGGSLSVDASTYITRDADQQLYEALLREEFCYVFNCRQMGKSSLRVQVKKRLEQAGYACVSIDMTNIGSNTVSPLQWYKGIASELWRGLGLTKKIKLKRWWEEHSDLSLVQQLNRFITDGILPNIEAEKIFIFIDEIDSIISVDFPTDDFFALIRYFYNARAENPEFKRLSFALFGVATPSELIEDPKRTPFNVGTAIELTGFTLEQATPLLEGLADTFHNASVILQEILHWTGGQPFLTQKVCKLAVEKCNRGYSCSSSGGESKWVEQLVTTNIIENWESHDEPEHLRTIRDRLLRNESIATRLLDLSERIYRRGFILADETKEQRYLLLSNLVVKRRGQLVYRNPIYQRIFNLDWLDRQQDRLRPFGREADLWIASEGQDESRLLRGKALIEAQEWAKRHNISQEEYQFLDASREQEEEQIRQKLELQRLQEVETRLLQEQKLARTQRILLGTIGTALGISTGLGIFAYQSYLQTKLKEIEAHINSANNYFQSDRYLPAVIDSMKAVSASKIYSNLNPETAEAAELSLKQAVYNVSKRNIFAGHRDLIFDVAFSPDGELIVSSGADDRILLWEANGKLLGTVGKHTESILAVTFSPDGEIIASGSDDGKVRLWTTEGVLYRTLSAHNRTVNRIVYSPDGELIVSVSEDKKALIWSSDGKLIQELLGHKAGLTEVAISRDGEVIATGDREGVLKLWNRQGRELASFMTHGSPIRGIDFSPDGKRLVTGGDDNFVKIWNLNGGLIRTFGNYEAPVTQVKYSSDGKTIAASSWDGSLKMWSSEGLLIEKFEGHDGRVWRFAWSPDGDRIVTAGWDRLLKLWQLNDLLATTFYGHDSTVLNVKFQPQGNLIASASDDGTVKIWQPDGSLVTDFTKHDNATYEAVFSEDGEIIASTSYDGTIKLWRTDGTMLASFDTGDLVTDVRFAKSDRLLISTGLDAEIRFWQIQRLGTALQVNFQKAISAHRDRVSEVDLSPDGKTIASASLDGYLKLWDLDGNLLNSFYVDAVGAEAVSFDPLGEFVVTSGKERNIKIWTLEGKLVRTLEGHKASVLDVELSRDGQLIASASGDNTVKIWNRQGKLLTTLKGHQGIIFNVEFSPDSKQLITASEDKTLKLWELETILELDTFDYSCDWVSNYLKYNQEIDRQERELCDG